MVELSRRFFLGGAIALVAVQTFKPTLAIASNMPTIYGDGKNCDAAGFSALFGNEPVIFSKEQLGIDSHEGIIFYKGNFKITKPIEILKDTLAKFEGKVYLNASELSIGDPLIIYNEKGHLNTQALANNLYFGLPLGHKVPLMMQANGGEKYNKGNFDLKADRGDKFETYYRGDRL
jgi:hypothetical protein